MAGKIFNEFHYKISFAFICLSSLSALAKPSDFNKDEEFSFLEQGFLDSEEEIIKNYGFAQDQVSYVVFDLDNSRTLESSNELEAMIPASVTKLLTMSAMGSQYPVSHNPKTKILIDGEIQNGFLRGNLYLKAGLDAKLDDAALGKLAQRLRLMGLRHIGGRVFYDDFDAKSLGQISPIFGDDHSYNTGFSALNFDKNLIVAKLSKRNGKWVVTNNNLTPSLQIRVVDEIPGEDATSFWDADSEDAGTWLIQSSKITEEYFTPDGAEIELPIKNPAQFAAERFVDHLRWRGIGMGGRDEIPRRKAEPIYYREILFNSGDKFKEFAGETLLTSNNLMAEVAGVMSAKALYRGFRGSIHDAAQIVDEYWTKRAKIEDEEFELKNSSGLTPYNFISARAMKKALLQIWPQELSDKTRFVNLMSQKNVNEVWGGESGNSSCSTLWSKSGYLSYVRGLAGFFCSKEGDVKGFVIFINDKWAREVLNSKGADPEYSRVVAEADAWAERSAKLRSDLLRHWIEAH